MKNTLFPELKWGREASSKMDEFIGEEIVELSRAIVTRVIFPTRTGRGNQSNRSGPVPLPAGFKPGQI